MTRTRAPSFSTARRARWLNSPGDSSAGSTCWTDEGAALLVRTEVHPDRRGPAVEHGRALVEGEDRGVLAPLGGGERVLRRDGRLAAARRPHEQQARPALRATAEQRVERGEAARHGLVPDVLPGLGRDEAREHHHAARPDDEVVVAAAVPQPAELHDAHPAALRSVLGGELLHRDDAVDEALEERVRRAGLRVVDEEDRAPQLLQAPLHREDLAAVPEPALREQPQLRAGVEHDPRRPEPVDLLQDEAHPLAELHLRRLVERRLGLVLRAVARDLEDREAFEGPAVGRGDRVELLARLGEADVQGALAGGDAREQELQRQRRLARAGVALHEVHPALRKPPVEHRVESHDTGRELLLARSVGCRHRPALRRVSLPSTRKAAWLRRRVPDGPRGPSQAAGVGPAGRRVRNVTAYRSARTGGTWCCHAQRAAPRST